MTDGVQCGENIRSVFNKAESDYFLIGRALGTVEEQRDLTIHI